jgi:hypothetical protein
MDEDNVDMSIGRKIWVIAEGYIPGAGSGGDDRRFVSHETACVLNANGTDAHVRLTLYFHDRPPQGPYRFTVPAQRTLHLRFNDLDDPQAVPRETDYSSVFESDLPIVVQHTRLDSRRQALALMTTTAYSQ